MYTRAFLKLLVFASRTLAEVIQYSTQILNVLKRLLDQGKIGRLDQSFLYVQSFSEKIQRELFYRSSLSRAYARDPGLIPIGISPRLRAEAWHDV
jgi:hypothetical protein